QPQTPAWRRAHLFSRCWKIYAYVPAAGDGARTPKCASAAKVPTRCLTAMVCRGVRGATTVTANSREEILSGTRQLLALMIGLNGIEAADVASAIFTTTVDLNAEFPALAARQLGWLEVPLLCTHELDVPG